MTASRPFPLDRSWDKPLLLLLCTLLLACASSSAQPSRPLPADRAQAQRAMASLASQGVLPDVSGDKAGEPVPRSEFAAALKRLFDLPPPDRNLVFSDVPQGSPDYDAIAAVAPFLQRQMRCPGCALTTTIGVGEPIDRVEAAVTVTGILLAQQKTSVVTSARAQHLLPSAGRLAPNSQPLQLYLATAVNAGVLRSSAEAVVPEAPAKFTRADLALMLGGVQAKYKIPVRSYPR